MFLSFHEPARNQQGVGKCKPSIPQPQYCPKHTSIYHAESTRSLSGTNPGDRIPAWGGACRLYLKAFWDRNNAAVQNLEAGSQQPGTSSQWPDTHSQWPGTSSQWPNTRSQWPGPSSSQWPNTRSQWPDTSRQWPGTSSQ